MRKEIKTKKQLIERLNEIDRKCIDEGTHFYDFKTLFESNSDRLSAQDKLALKKAVDIGDKEAIEAVFQAKMAEDLDLEGDEFDDYYNEEEDDLELTTDDMNGGQWFESLIEDIDSEEDIRNYAKELVKSISSKLKSYVTRSYNNYVKEYGKKGAIDTLKYIYFYVYLTGDEEAFDNDDYLYSLVYSLTQNSSNNSEDLSEYLWYYIREFIREYFSKKYLNKEYIIKDLKEGINRYSDVIPKEERKFWYFTTHGVQPGSIPDDLNILEIKDTPNGTFVALDGVLNTSELIKYDIKEKAPMDELLDNALKEEINLNDYDDGYVELRDGKPQFVYSTLRDAKDGMFWSQRGDIEYGSGKHSYEIKKWENGKLKDLNESVEEPFFPSTGIGWFDKIYNDLSNSERAQMNHIIKNIFHISEDEMSNINEDTLNAIIDKFEDININESYEDGEYDYFVVYKGKIMQGEYPTYEEAKKNADKNCIIKGVIQYGGSEFEETEIKESFEEELGFNDYLLKNYGITSDDLSDDDYDKAWNEFENYQSRGKYLKEDANQTKEFEYELTIYIDASSQDDYFDYNGEYDFIDKEDIQYSLNSYMEKIYLGFPDFDFDIYEEDTIKDTIIETLYVDVPQEENITYKGLKDKLRKIINDWSYNTTVEVEQQTDVDDFITHYIDVIATADIDTK